MAIRTIVHTHGNVMILILSTGPKELSSNVWLSVYEATELVSQLHRAIETAQSWEKGGR